MTAVETVLQQFGYQRPRWYQRFKDHIAGLTGDAERFPQAADAAELTHARVNHTIGFLAGLSPPTQAVLRAHLTAAVKQTRTSSVPMLALRAHVP